MTVATTLAVQSYTGNGVTTDWPTNFYLIDASHLVVERRLAADNTLDHTYTSAEYTLTGVGSAGGATVSISPALSSTYTIVMYRSVPFNQLLDLINAGGFYPDTLEAELDKLTMISQELGNFIDRTIKLPANEVAPDFGSFASIADGDTIVYEAASGTFILTNNAAVVAAAVSTAAAAAAVAAFTATSVTSNTIGTGAFTFYLDADAAFTGGMNIVIADSSAPDTNYMLATVSSYVSSTKKLDVIVAAGDAFGSGTFVSWDIGMAVTGDALLKSGGTMAGDLKTLSYTETVVDLGTSATLAPDLSLGTMFIGTTSGVTALDLPVAVAGKSFSLIATFGGADALSFVPNGTDTLVWSGGAAPTPTSSASAQDEYGFNCYVTGQWVGHVGGQALA